MTLIPPDAGLRKEILADIDMTDELLNEYCDKLREWLKKQPHLPQFDNDSFLKSFIVNGKSLEGAKQRMDLYYTNRLNHPKIYGERTVQVGTRCKFISITVLPQLTPDGCRVQMITTHPSDPSQMDLYSHLLLSQMMTDLLLLEDTPVRGMYLVYDVAHCTSSHVARIPFVDLAKFLRDVQGSVPMRVKGVIVINAASVIDVTVNTVFKPIAPAKLYERLHIYSEGMEALKNHFPLEILPKDYGGQDKSTQEISEEWLKKLEANEHWFKTDGIKTVDESLRTKELNNEQFGLAGSFRKLQVD